MHFFDNTEINEYSALADRALKDAFESARNRNKVSRIDRSVLTATKSRYLYAANHKSRVIWGKAISEQVAEFFCHGDGIEHDQRIYLVTLVHADCVTAISDTAPDIECFKKHLRHGLRGHSFLGAIEPAYYSNVQAGIGAQVNRKKCVFWHIHVFLWGVTARECRELINRLNLSGRYQPIIDGFKGAHRKLIKRGDLPAVTGYIFKPPGLGYRLGQTIREEYGRLETRLHQNTSPLRPGERINLFCAMSGLYLDGLALAGGEGVPLLAAAKKQALKVSGYARMMSDERARKRRRSGGPRCARYLLGRSQVRSSKSNL
jgi:hypothetical protein